jgi:hypothetical protein
VGSGADERVATPLCRAPVDKDERVGIRFSIFETD